MAIIINRRLLFLQMSLSDYAPNLTGKGGSPISGDTIFHMATKLMRVLLSYVALVVTTNYFTQVYVNKVLVNGENPPALTNFVIMFFVIDMIAFSIISVLLYVLSGRVDMGVNSTTFVSKVVPDYFVASALTVVTGMLVAQKMYDKKYFLYKDDGMRGIRALKEILFNLSLVFTIVPFNYMVAGFSI